jgi:hypothetical protein
MKIEWIISNELEQKYLDVLADQIKLGNFQEEGILLFEEYDQDIKVPYLIYPLDRKKISFAIDEGTSLIARLKKELQLIEHEFLNDFTLVFPNIKFSQIKIVPTIYGLRNWQIIEDQTLYVFHRIDFTAEHILTTIIDSVIISEYLPNRSQGEENIFKSNLWIEKEAIISFMLKNTFFAKYLPEYSNLNEQTMMPELDIEIKKKSNENYLKLGYPVKSSLQLNDGQVYIDGQKIVSLTKNQTNILQVLLESEGSIVSFDELAKIMWEEDHIEKYSLSSITKMVHLLRQGLKSNGLLKEVIFTKRGKGYILIQ